MKTHFSYFSDFTQAPYLSICNYGDIYDDGAAGCYHCTTTDVSPDSILGPIEDQEGETGICPHCHVDALVAHRHMPEDPRDRKKWLTQARWSSWDHTKDEDFKDDWLPRVIETFVEAAHPSYQEEVYRDYQGFCEELDRNQGFCEELDRNQGFCEELDAELDQLYNQWENQTPELTDGLLENYDMFLQDESRHIDQASLPQPKGGFMARLALPYDDDDLWHDRLHVQHAMGHVIGSGARHLRRLIRKTGCDDIQFRSIIRDGDIYHDSDLMSDNHFEIWGDANVLEVTSHTLSRHIRSRMTTYKRGYYKNRIMDVFRDICPEHLPDAPNLLEDYLEADRQGVPISELVDDLKWNTYHRVITDFYQKFCPSKVDDVGWLLDRYWETLPELYRAIVEKYQPTGCRVHMCDSCDVHFCPNYPPSEDHLICDDCADREVEAQRERAPLRLEDLGSNTDPLDSGYDEDDWRPSTSIEQCDGWCYGLPQSARCRECGGD